jgi:hypothetical protein
MRSGGSGGVRGVSKLIEISQVAVKRAKSLNDGRPPFDDGERSIVHLDMDGKMRVAAIKPSENWRTRRKRIWSVSCQIAGVGRRCRPRLAGCYSP